VSESNDRLLQDYLDGRLPPGDRAEFERRLEREPDLARRVRELRELGDALRGGTEELSPEFYARARERFEAGRPRRWFRPLSLETAGLAAAVVLAVAVFVPPILEREDLGVPRPTKSVSAAGPEAAAQPEPAETLSDTGPDRDVGEDDKNVAPMSREVGKDEGTEVGRSVADETSDRLAKKKRRAPEEEPVPAAPVAVGELKEDSAKPKDSATSDLSAGVADRRSEAEQERTDAPRQAGAYDKLAQAAPAEAIEESDSYFNYRANAYPVAPVGGAAVGAGELRVLSGEDAQAVLSSLGDGFANVETEEARDKRLVLIGRRDHPFGCRMITVRVYEDHYGLVLTAPTDVADPGSLGCAVLLPDDGLPVEVENGDD
jgi:hypothetical protein